MSSWNLAAVAITTLSGMVPASLVLAFGTARVTQHLRAPAIGPDHEDVEMAHFKTLKKDF